VLTVAAALLVAPAAAEQMDGIEPARLFPWATFDPDIPTQEQVLGVAPGARPLGSAEVVRYFEALADASPRAQLRTYSRSWEGRDLVYLVVCDEGTEGRIDGFRAEHAQLVDPRGRSAARDEAELENAKAVAWMAYSIHGDELSSADAAASLAYWLVAGEDDRAKSLREKLVILIDPLENPDGRDRFLAQTQSFAHARPNPDQEDLSHTTVWPWGRGNHYLFDLNRDWFTMVQPESRRSEVIASWNPQLMVDSHEMGADDTYLFPPPRHPYNPHLPSTTLGWLHVFAADQSNALDERGYAYYTREWNEEFFPGYGSSWAAYLGAIGVLYEMSSTEGTLVSQRGGVVRTYPQAVEHHVASSVANLETLAANRARILRDYVRGRREVMEQAAQGEVRTWIFTSGARPDRADALAALLERQGIEVLRLAEPVRVEKLRDARTGDLWNIELPAGSWMVRLDQPSGRLARVLLDPHVPMETTFLREEREYLERGRDSRIYDATAWSLPLLYGVDAYWTATKPRGEWQDVEPPRPAGWVGGPGSVYAWVVPGAQDASSGVLADLLQRGINVRIAEKAFRVAGHDYDRGAILIKREGNPEDLHVQLGEVAERWQVEIRATPTARAQDGPDLGGQFFHPLVEPRVAVLAGMPTSTDDYGAIWFALDVIAGLRFSAIDVGRFSATDLGRYNVLVLPPLRPPGGAGNGEGGIQAYRQALGVAGVEKLRAWIEAGGTAIGIGNGAELLADRDLGWTKARLRRQALDRFAPAVLGASAEDVATGASPRAVGLRPAEPPEPPATPAPQTPSASTPPASPIAEDVSPYDVAPILGPGALPFASGVDLGVPAPLEPLALEAWIEPLLPSGVKAPSEADMKWADDRLRRFHPVGALLRVELDPDAWMSWGLPHEITAWIAAEDTLVAEPPVRVAARFPEVERLHLGGLLWPEAAARIAHTAYCTRERIGRGQVVLYLDNPAFRAWMLDTRRHFLNSVLYGPGLGSEWPRPW